MYKYLLICLFCVSSLQAQEAYVCEIPQEIRDHYTNYGSGSCVYMSIGINGIHRNNLNAASCPWDSVYGPENVGGAGPSHVTKMAKQRNLACYNVTTDNYEDMKKWFIWSTKTNRFAAIGAGSAHFQTLYGYDPQRNVWYVCNNNSPKKVDEYTEEGFQRLHSSSGYWSVFLVGPSPPQNPRYVSWWK